jgi:hypothetical protein
MRSFLSTPLGIDLATSTIGSTSTSSSTSNTRIASNICANLGLSQGFSPWFGFEMILENLYRESLFVDLISGKPKDRFYVDSKHRLYLSNLTAIQYSCIQDNLIRDDHVHQYIITLQMLLKLNSCLCYYDPRLTDLDWIPISNSVGESSSLPVTRNATKDVDVNATSSNRSGKQLYPISILPYLVLISTSVLRIRTDGEIELSQTCSETPVKWGEIYQDRGYFYPPRTYFAIIPSSSGAASQAKMYPLAICSTTVKSDPSEGISYPGVIYEPVLISNPLTPSEMMCLFSEGKYRRSTTISHINKLHGQKDRASSLKETISNLDFYLFSLSELMDANLSKVLS